MLYRESTDTKVSSTGIEVRTGRKWRAQEAVDQAEAQLQHRVLVGTVKSGCAGLILRPRCEKVRGKDRHQLVQEEIRAGVEERCISRMVRMRKQGVGA